MKAALEVSEASSFDLVQTLVVRQRVFLYPVRRAQFVLEAAPLSVEIETVYETESGPYCLAFS